MILSKSDTAFLKGIAILMIVMHNFCHWLPGCVAENEYTFSAERIRLYLHHLSQGGPHLILNFFSHYGHYGVPLFLFLSGYGLVRKYEAPHRCAATKAGSTPDEPVPTCHRLSSSCGEAFRFVWQHAVKLWKLMLPAIAIYWCYCQFSHKAWEVKPADLLAMVSYTANFFYVRDLILGPWWFFSLILQLYVVYRFVLYPFRGTCGETTTGFLRRHAVLAGVTTACFLLQTWLYYYDVRMTPDWQFYIHDTTPHHWDLFNYCRYNFPTSMLPFALGVLLAREDSRKDNVKGECPPPAAVSPVQSQPSSAALLTCCVAGAVLLLLSAFNSLLWLLSPIFLLCALVPLAHLVRRKAVRSLLEWVGGISAALFAVHPIVRAATILAAKQAEWRGEWMQTYVILAAYVLISLAGAWCFSMVIKRMNLSR